MDSPSSDPTAELVYDCPDCNKPIAIDVRAVGMEVACPYCDGKNVVPLPDAGGLAATESDRGGEPASLSDQTVPDETPGADLAVPSGGIPPKREAGALPKREVPEEPPEPPGQMERAAKPDPAAQPPPAGDAILTGLAKGEIEVLPARRVGRKIVFGCPFCARPIEIKPKAEGKEMNCPECSGRLVAPDLASGGQALPMSGTAGKAGGATLPGDRSLSSVPGPKPPAGGTKRPTVAKAEKLPDPPDQQAKDSPVAGDPESMAAHRLNADKIAKLVPRDEAEAGFHMEKAWASYPDASPVAHAWSHRLKPLLVMAMLGLIAAGIVAGVVLMKRQQATEIADAGEMAGEMAKREAQGDVDADSPAQVLLRVMQGFVEANTVAERMQYVRDPEEVEGSMKLYYGRTRNPPPIPPLDALTYVEKELNGVPLARISSVEVEGESRRAFFFELTPDGGALLDWGSAVGFGDVAMRAFALSPPTRAVEMRVLVRRSDYYNHEFADSNALASYEITDLGRTGVVYGYTLRDGAVDTTLSKLLPEGSPAWINCILSLAPHESWEKRNPPQLRIEGLLSNGWLKF